MGSYIFAVIIFQTLFLAAYKLWLQKETFFQANRIYLLVTPLLALALPFIEIEFLETSVTLPQAIVNLPEVFIGEQAPSIQQLPAVIIAQEQAPFNWQHLLVGMYAAGVLLSLGWLLKRYSSVSRFFRFKRKEDNSIINLPNRDEAFTFMKTIFIGDKIQEPSRSQIIAHEQVHVREKHGLDLLYFEFLRVVFWFNPFIYSYQKAIRELHEYIADRKVLATTTRKSYYNELLNTAFGTQKIAFINTFFNHSLIKKRIVMSQKQSKTKAKLKYLILLPLVAGMLTYVSCSTDAESVSDKESILKDQVSDLLSTIKEKETVTADEQKLILELVSVANSKMKGIPAPPPPPTSTTTISVVGYEKEVIEKEELEDIPFAVIDEVPRYPGCEGLSEIEAKACMSDKINQLVNQKFNTQLGEKLGLTGVNRIYVRFKIDKNGNVVNVESRGPHPELEKEAERVMQLLPKMTPGKQGGETKGVLYSLPIVFKVNE